LVSFVRLPYYHFGASSLNSSPSFFLVAGAGLAATSFSLMTIVLPPPAC